LVRAACIVKLESDGVATKEKFTPHFNDWMQACGTRNENANKMIHAFDKSTLNKLLGKEAASISQDRSARYEIAIQKKENGKADLQQDLKDNFEALVYKLFPESPTRRDRNGLAVGRR